MDKPTEMEISRHYVVQYFYPVGQMGREAMTWVSATTHATYEQASHSLDRMFAARDKKEDHGRTTKYRIVEMETVSRPLIERSTSGETSYIDSRFAK